MLRSVCRCGCASQGQNQERHHWVMGHSLTWEEAKSFPLVVQSLSHLVLCPPLLLLPPIFPSIRIFSSESALCVKWLEYWSFLISPSNEYSGLISFRDDWFDLLAVQGALKSLLQNWLLYKGWKQGNERIVEISSQVALIGFHLPPWGSLAKN